MKVTAKNKRMFLSHQISKDVLKITTQHYKALSCTDENNKLVWPLRMAIWQGALRTLRKVQAFFPETPYLGLYVKKLVIQVEILYKDIHFSSE